MNRHVCVFEWGRWCVVVGGAAGRLQIDLTPVTLMAFVFYARPKNQGQLSLFNPPLLGTHTHTH